MYESFNQPPAPQRHLRNRPRDRHAETRIVIGMIGAAACTAICLFGAAAGTAANLSI